MTAYANSRERLAEHSGGALTGIDMALSLEHTAELAPDLSEILGRRTDSVLLRHVDHNEDTAVTARLYRDDVAWLHAQLGALLDLLTTPEEHHHGR